MLNRIVIMGRLTRDPELRRTGSGTPVKSPMPGTILSVNVSEGKTVAEGDVLFILEAMKMENEIVAPAGGTVNKIVTAKGSSVATDEVLAFIG